MWEQETPPHACGQRDDVDDVQGSIKHGLVDLACVKHFIRLFPNNVVFEWSKTTVVEVVFVQCVHSPWGKLCLCSEVLENKEKGLFGPTIVLDIGFGFVRMWKLEFYNENPFPIQFVKQDTNQKAPYFRTPRGILGWPGGVWQIPWGAWYNPGVFWETTPCLRQTIPRV